MITEKLNSSGKKIHIYQEPSVKEKEERFNKLVSVFTCFAQSEGIDESKIEFNFKLINEINIRIDKRRDYYIIFHDETHLSEVRETALIAFWILKFKPFMLKSDGGSEYNLNLNSSFAAYVILAAVSENIEREYGGSKVLSINEEYIKKFKYALKYWDLSKEAMMLVAETLCACTEDKE